MIKRSKAPIGSQLTARDSTFYGLLGVSRKHSPEQLKSNWQRLARSAHPDKGGSAERFAALSQAYACLSDRELRRKYDAAIDLLTEPCANCQGLGETRKQKGFVGCVTTLCETCGGSGRRL